MEEKLLTDGRNHFEQQILSELKFMHNRCYEWRKWSNGWLSRGQRHHKRLCLKIVIVDGRTQSAVKRSKPLQMLKDIVEFKQRGSPVNIHDHKNVVCSCVGYRTFYSEVFISKYYLGCLYLPLFFLLFNFDGMDISEKYCINEFLFYIFYFLYFIIEIFYLIFL